MRADLDIIQKWIKPGSRVLDLGCGDGSLLAYLRDNKHTIGIGLEIDNQKTFFQEHKYPTAVVQRVVLARQCLSIETGP